MRNALFVVAGLLVTCGIGFVYWPAALIAAGLLVGASAVFSDE